MLLHCIEAYVVLLIDSSLLCMNIWYYRRSACLLSS